MGGKFHSFWASIVLFLGLCIAPLAALDPTTSPDQYLVDLWQVADGLPQNSILSIVQTRDGYIWLGTFEGLARFDGVKFTVFDRNNTPAFRHNNVFALCQDRHGDLWVGTPAGLLRGDGVTWRGVPLSSDGGEVFVNAILEAADGTMWIGTTNGLYRSSPGGWQRLGTAEGLSDSFVSALATDSSGRIFVGTNRGLSVLAGGRWNRPEGGGGLREAAVLAIASDSRGRVFVGTGGQGLFCREGEKWTHFTRSDGLPDLSIRSVLVDRSGTLWIGTEQGGVALWRQGRFFVLNKQTGLASQGIRSFAEDREGSLWIGTYYSGLNRLKDGKFFFYGNRQGLPGEYVRSVLAGRDRKIWIGTSGGGLACLRDGRFEVFDRARGLENDRIWSIAEGRRGEVWFGTYGGGLHRLRDGRITVWNHARGLSNDIVRAVLVDRRGWVWAGTNGGGIDVLVGEEIRFRLNRQTGLSNDFVYSIVEDAAGIVWIGTYGGGLNRWENGRITHFTTRDGLANDVVFALTPDAEGNLWITTNMGGLCRFRDGIFRRYTSREGLYSDVAFAVVEDRQGRLWMSCNRGLFYVVKRELDELDRGQRRRIVSVPFDHREGVKDCEGGGPGQPAGTRDEAGTLWFGTVKGLVAVDPARWHVNREPPPVRIEGLTADGRAFRATPGMALPARTRRLGFDYTALSLLVPNRVTFKTRLDGFDQEWSEVTTRRSIHYTNLPPGEYVFRVVAANNDGVWNSIGTSLPFSIRPAFYQTGWFGLGMALLALALLWCGQRWWLRHMRRRQGELETLVSERTHQLQEANAVKTELLHIAAHDLKNPLQAVLGYASLMGETRDGGGEAAGYAERIHRAASSMLKLIDELLESARLDDGEFVLDRVPVDIGQLTRAVAAGFHFAAERKRQRIVCEAVPDAFCRCDPGRLREVMENLIGNAVKFSPPEKTIRIGCDRQGGRIRFSVTDEGPGLSDEDKARLFGKFSRLSARPTGGELSTGMGLAIAKRLIELLGGEIFAASEGRGHGSCFGFFLPEGESDPGSLP